MWARAPARRELDAHRALAPGLDRAVGRFAEKRDVASHQVGAIANSSREPVVDRVDLLRFVEHEREVDGRV